MMHEVVRLSHFFDLHMTFASFTSNEVFFPAVTASAEKPALISMRQTPLGYFPMTVISPRGMPPVLHEQTVPAFSRLAALFFLSRMWVVPF